MASVIKRAQKFASCDRRNNRYVVTNLMWQQTAARVEQSKAPCITPSERHQPFSGVFCNVTGTTNAVIYDDTNPATLYPPLWVGLMSKGLLSNHAKLVIAMTISPITSSFVSNLLDGNRSTFMSVLISHSSLSSWA